MSATTLNKRKIEEDSDDEDVQLFLKLESENNKKLKSTEEKMDETTPKTPKQPSKDKEVIKAASTPSNNNVTAKNVSTPKSFQSIQTKLPFKSLQPANLDKTPQSPHAMPSKEKEDTNRDSQHQLIIRSDGEWFIEDFLLDKEWRSLLEDEFEKKYFIEINNVIRAGYNKNILRPPKELVFNALNSTPLKKVTKI